MFKSAHHHVSKLAIAAVLGGFMVAAPVYAQTNDATAPASPAMMAPAAAPTTAPAAAMTATPKAAKVSKIENHIKTLHDKLKLTAAQEDQWKAVADVMRDNAESMHQLTEERHENSAHMNAIDDLQSYQKIAQAHADGVQKLIPVFQALYDTMTPDQKANADSIFGAYEGHPERKAAAKSSPATSAQ